MAALIFVTGATRGFGRAIAETLYHSSALMPAGSTLVLMGRNADALQAACSQLQSSNKCTIDSVAMDLTSSTTVDAQMTEILERFLPASQHTYKRVVIVHNAGVIDPLTPTPSLEEAQRSIDINLTSTIAMTSRLMRHAPGLSLVLVNISSLAALQAFDPAWAMYGATKAARELYFKSLALLPYIRVLNYAPGPMETDMTTFVRTEMPQGNQLRNQFNDMHANKRLVQPVDSARVLINLLEKDAYDNGAHIDIFDIIAPPS